MIVVAGPSKGSLEFAEGLAKNLGAELTVAEHKTFPDGETYVRVKPESVDWAIVVQTMSRPQDTSIIQALLLADALGGIGVNRLTLVAPYTAYARQDKRFLPGEPISIGVLLRVLSSVGYSDFYTVEIHKEEALSAFPGNAKSIFPFIYMAEKAGLDSDVVFLAPDIGALKRVERVARHFGAKYDYLVKKRDRVTGEIQVETKHLDVRGVRVVIVDDIISTGGTISRATSMLLEQGAESVEVLVAHAVMAGGALERLKKVGVKRVYAANTLPRIDDPLLTYIDVSPLVAEAIRGASRGG